MQRPALNNNRNGATAFALTVLAALAPMFFANPAWLSETRGWAILGLGLLYTGSGIVLAERLDAAPHGWKVAYLGGQLALAGSILYLGQIQGFSSLLVFPLVSQGHTLLPRRWGYVWSGVIILAFVGLIASLTSWSTALLNGLVISAGVVFVSVFTLVTLAANAARQEVERLAAELQTANQQLRAYAAQVEELATAKERNRLAREIHDSLGHYLTVINVQLEAAKLLAGSDPARQQIALQRAQSLAQEGLADVRRSVAALRAPAHASQPLAELLAQLVEQNRAAGILTDLTLLGPQRPLSAQMELTLYRAAQEALTNIRKHSRASQATLTLDGTDPRQIRLSAQDNGIGVGQAHAQSAPNAAGFGLLGVRERVQLLNGTVHTHSAPGQGFRLDIQLPLE